MTPGAREIARRARRALSRREYPVVPTHVGRLDYPGAEILVGVTSRTEILSRLRPCAKEPWTVSWLERTLRAGDVLYDIGANVGAYSLIAASLGREPAGIVAVEPASANFAALCDNVSMNGFEALIVPLPVLLGDRTGLTALAGGEAGAAEHDVEGAGLATISYRLDELISTLGLPEPTVLKIDVDGAEAAVLSGGADTLARPELRSVLVELDRAGGDAVEQMLAAAGLALAERIDARGGAPLARVWYGIFERG